MTTGSRRSRGTRSRQASTGGAALTARGAIAILLVMSAAGLLIGQLFDVTWPCGVVFVAGCLATSLWVRPSDVLGVSVAPPLVYFLALFIVQLVASMSANSFWQSLLLGVVLNLSGMLFWLLGGSVLTVAVLMLRGLPAAIGELRTDLRGEHSEPAEVDESIEPRPQVAPQPPTAVQRPPGPPRPAPQPPRGGPGMPPGARPAPRHQAPPPPPARGPRGGYPPYR